MIDSGHGLAGATSDMVTIRNRHARALELLRELVDLRNYKLLKTRVQFPNERAMNLDSTPFDPNYYEQNKRRLWDEAEKIISEI